MAEKIDGRTKAGREARLRAAQDDEPTEVHVEEEDVESLPDEDSDEPRLHAILSNAEYRDAQEKARLLVLKKKRANAREDVIARETARLMREDGLTTGSSEKDEIVSVLIDLPPFARNVSINGFEYTNGGSYKVPRHVYDTLREQMQRAWAHEDQIEGKSIKEHLARVATRSPNVVGESGAFRSDRYDA